MASNDRVHVTHHFAGTSAASSVRVNLRVLLRLGERPRDVFGLAVPRLDFDQGLRTGERMRRLGLRAVRRQQVDDAAAVHRPAGLAHRFVQRRGFEAVGDAARQPLGEHRRADHRAAVVVDFDQIVLLDAARRGILRIHAHDPVVPILHLHPVVRDIEQEAVLAVALGVEAVLAVRREQLQRIFPEQLARLRALPRRHVFDDRRPLRIVQTLEAVALELELARLGLQAFEELHRVVGRQWVRLRNVLLAAFPEPAEGDRRAQMLLLRRHDEVAAANELLPRHHLGHVGRIE